MNAQLEMIPGTNRSAEHSQYFTPKKLAEKVVQWAGVGQQLYPEYRRMRVLEPSAGNGALVRPLVAAGADVTAIEIDERYSIELADALQKDAAHCGHDFLSLKPGILYGPQDLCVMNPPYHDDGEAKFITHALKFAPRVVGIFRADVFYTVSRGEALWKHVLPRRVAFCSRRPWKGAETDYVVLELVRRSGADNNMDGRDVATVEWWGDSW